MKDLAAAAALYQDGQSNAQTGRNADNQEVNAIEAQETAEWLLTAAPVAEVADNAIQRQGQRYEEVVGKLYKEKWNNLVQRGNWTVKLTKAGIIASLRHGYGRLKINAFAAVPEVILNGRIIDSNKNWKGRGYDSYIIAAPIRLGADDYLCEVIINTNKDGTFNFYLHEVIRKPLGAHSGGMDTTNAPGASTSNIARFLKKVKGESEKSAKKLPFQGDPSILYQSIGELGAQALDAAEDATTRLDNLATAKAMEVAGKDTRAVRLATGWERGADGKWRYEIPDIKTNKA
jgi:hypothetical protein